MTAAACGGLQDRTDRFDAVLGASRGVAARGADIRDPDLIGPDSYPQYRMDSPFGELTIMPQGDVGAYVSGRVTVNRIQVDVTLHMAYTDSMGWLGEGMSARRTDRFLTDATPNARMKLHETLVPLAAAWLVEHPGELALSVRAQRRMRYDRALIEYERKREELAQQRAALDAIAAEAAQAERL